MTTRIINRGRGPEIEGTRITIYRIMDFVRDNCSMTTIADELDGGVSNVDIDGEKHLVDQSHRSCHLHF